MKVEVLILPGCGDGERTAELVAQVVREQALGTVETILVRTSEDAERLAFVGSPTVRLDGVDIEPNPPRDVGLT